MEIMDDDLCNEVLRGAGPIAKVLYGEDNKQNRRRVYHKAETGVVPIWREGALLVTTRTALREHYRRQPDQKSAA
jgi:hypothetical protein